MSTSDVDQRTTDVTVLEKKFSYLEFKYKHKRQQLEQQINYKEFIKYQYDITQSKKHCKCLVNIVVVWIID